MGKKRPPVTVPSESITSMFERMNKKGKREIQHPVFAQSFPGYAVHNTPTDGNCFFSALAHQLGRPMSDATFIRAELIAFIRNHHQELTDSDNSIDWTQATREYGGLHNYLNTMGLESTWADGIIIETATRYYNRPIVVLYSGSERKIQFSHQRLPCSSEPLQIGYVSTAGNEIFDHYVSLIRELNDVSDETAEKSQVIASPTENSNATGSIQSEKMAGFNSTTARPDDELDRHEVPEPFPNVPYQPDVSKISTQAAGTRILHFQQHWFTRFSWLHYSCALEAVLCYPCAKAEYLKLTQLATKRETAFTVNGFRNWKKALQKFQDHANSASHQFSLQQVEHASIAKSVDQQLSQQTDCAQRESLTCLSIIFTSIKYLARQGLALRGHDDCSGNLKQLLKLRAQDSLELQQWLEKKADFTSPLVQNEILQLLSNSVVRSIASSVRESGSFAVIVDGTQDVSKKEQLSICLRYVDEQLFPHEVFVGMYEPPSTTGEDLARSVEDVLIRLNLPLAALRGQTYDGASNMSGQYKGCQALINEKQPLALYTHCGAHVVNLVAQAVSEAVVSTRDAIQSLHELGSLFSQSIKCRSAFQKIVETDHDITKLKQIRPICPTRWLVRVPAITAVLDQYDSILLCLDEMSATPSGSHVAARASGLLAVFSASATLLCLKMAVKILGPLEMLNRSLQSRYQTVAGMCSAVEEVVDTLSSFRTEDDFDQILSDTNSMCQTLDLETLKVPRQRKPPKRVTGPATAHVAATVKDYYRPQFFTLIDTAVQQLKERFGNSVGLTKFRSIEHILLSGNVDEEVLSPYTELDVNDLKLQLQLFRRKRPTNSVDEVACALRAMLPETRGEYSEVEKLVRIIIVCPASSAEAERSFSALRRLKTWLRSTMTQTRLNSVAVCHVHQDLLDACNLDELIKLFITKCDSRHKVFGRPY